MNTEENPSYNILKAKYDEAVAAKVTHIALSVEDAAGLLNLIDQVEELSVGDEVEVTAEHVSSWGGSLLGDRGVLINIEPLADKYPYSVSFQHVAGLATYFARGELKKVEK